MKKQTLTIQVEAEFVIPVVKLIKSILTYKFGTEPNVKDFSFKDAAFHEIIFYYVATDARNQMIRSRIEHEAKDLMVILPEV